MLLKRLSVLILLFLSTLLVVYPSDAENRKDSLYGAISPADYVTGRFNALKSPLFVKLQDLGIPCNERDHHLRREAAAALKDMIDAFRTEHPNSPVWVTSSTSPIMTSVISGEQVVRSQAGGWTTPGP